jgi:hypothetical protein
VRRPAFLALLALASACAGTRAVKSPERSPGEDAPAWHFLRERYDADHDGRIARAEYARSPQAFERLDADGDGYVSAADFDPDWDGVPRIAKSGAQKGHGRWIGFEDFVHGEGGPEVGDPAPAFRLAATTGEEVELAAFRGKKPVALVFGSYT